MITIARVLTRTLLHARTVVDGELHQKRSIQAKTRSHGAKDLIERVMFREGNLKNRELP